MVPGNQFISAKMHDILTFGGDAEGYSGLHPDNISKSALTVIKTKADSTSFIDTTLYFTQNETSVYAGNVSINLAPIHVEHVAELIAQQESLSGTNLPDPHYFALPGMVKIDGVIHADGHHSYSPVSSGVRANIMLDKINVIGESFSLMGEYDGVIYHTGYISARELTLGTNKLSRRTFSGDPELMVNVGNSETIPSFKILDRMTLLSHVLNHNIEGGFDQVAEMSGGELSYRVAMSLINGDAVDDVVNDLVDTYGLMVIDRELEYDRFPKPR
jgi:uncharacterized protein YqfB (UPF0267 family)